MEKKNLVFFGCFVAATERDKPVLFKCILPSLCLAGFDMPPVFPYWQFCVAS
jgi:hypothetical protein